MLTHIYMMMCIYIYVYLYVDTQSLYRNIQTSLYRYMISISYITYIDIMSYNILIYLYICLLSCGLESFQNIKAL